MNRPTWRSIAESLKELPDVTPAILTGVSTAAFYSVPDIFDSRTGRALAKVTSLLPAAIAAVAWSKKNNEEISHLTDADPDERLNDRLENLGDLATERPMAFTAIIGGAIAAAGGATVLSEKLIYHFAERREANGVTNAHTKHGLILGAVAAVAMIASQKMDQADQIFGVTDR